MVVGGVLCIDSVRVELDTRVIGVSIRKTVNNSMVL